MFEQQFQNNEHIGHDAFKWAIDNGKCEYIKQAHNKMIEESSEIRVKRKLSDSTAYYWAIENGRLESIKLLFELGFLYDLEVIEYAFESKQIECYHFLKDLY